MAAVETGGRRPQFMKTSTRRGARQQLNRVQSLPMNAGPAEWSSANGEWNVPVAYDYSKPTNVNYAAPQSEQGCCFGQYVAVRESRDFNYHGTYSRPRQLYQDSLVHNVVGASSSKDHPWIVFSAGAMGAGKSHVINWMSEMGHFPLPDIVTVDPDLFKTSFPEWPGYCRHKSETAGTLTRRESGYLVEIAQEVAMRQSKNVWVDGSLRNCEWYEEMFEQIRKNHSSYRIAILYVHAKEKQVLERAKRRAEQTGRHVPVEEIKDSLYRVPRTVAKLMPKADFVAHIENSGGSPHLTGFCDWNGCHRNVLGSWKEIKDRFATLPEFNNRGMWTAVVERNIAMPGVLVFSKTYCSYCAKLKALLRHIKIPFRAVELNKTHGGAAMQLVLAARPSSRCSTVPQLFARGKFIGGCSDALVLHAQGELEPTLRAAFDKGDDLYSSEESDQDEPLRGDMGREGDGLSSMFESRSSLSNFPVSRNSMSSKDIARQAEGWKDRPMLHRSLSR